MHDNEVFTEAMRPEDWTHLAGTGAAARAKSVRLRRTRYAGIAGGTAAAFVGAAVIAGTLGFGGGSAASAASAGPGGAPAKTGPVTMSSLFEWWKTCPDEALTVAGSAPKDLRDLQQAERDACHRDIATLSELLPSYEITPDVASIVHPDGTPLDMPAFENPSYVVPTGYQPHMTPNLYRVVSPDGTTTSLMIRAYKHVDMKPIGGEQVTLSNGLKATLALGTGFMNKGDKGYGIFILEGDKSFIMTASGNNGGKAHEPTPNFDLKTVVMSPQFASMAAAALAEPES